MIIDYVFNPGKKTNKSLKVKLELFKLAEELYCELDGKGFIKRLKNLPQLGIIKVNRTFAFSRFDYIALQLYLHRIINKELKKETAISYGNYININDAFDGFNLKEDKGKPTIFDLIQLLVICYNVGHFYNTFLSSRAILIYLNNDEEAKKSFINDFKDERFKFIASEIIKEDQYYRFHLLLSVLVLQKLDVHLFSVRLCIELLYYYLDNSANRCEKIKHVFHMFRKVREIAYIKLDLEASELPLFLDLHNKANLKKILKGHVTYFSDENYIGSLFSSISKLLNEKFYNNDETVIQHYRWATSLANNLAKKKSADSIYSLWFNKESIFNCVKGLKKDVLSQKVLKLTFSLTDKEVSKKLLRELQLKNHIRVGHYSSHLGKQNVLITISKRCKIKPKIAFNILKIVIKHLRTVQDIEAHDPRFLLATEFFLTYLFEGRYTKLFPTVDKSICVLCVRGKNNRINMIKNLLDNNHGNADQRHETKVIKEHMVEELDAKKDVSIIVPASVLIYNKDNESKTECEIDGMAIYPNRPKEQVVFFEAKNSNCPGRSARSCMREKMRKLNLPFHEESLVQYRKNIALKLDLLL